MIATLWVSTLRQYPATGDIGNGGEVDKAACHRNVRGVQCPDLIGLHDGKLAQATASSIL